MFKSIVKYDVIIDPKGVKFLEVGKFEAGFG